MTPPTHNDRVYAAGIVDGEGTVGIRRSRARYGITYRMVVSVVNTHWPLLTWLAERWGGSIHKAGKGAHHLGKKPIGLWTLSGPTAVPFLEEITPYLLIKRADALNCLAFQKLMQRGKRGPRLVAIEAAYLKYKEHYA
jgi:hypothetical protein